MSGEAARATLVQEGAPVAATVEFDAEGRMVLIRGERYRGVRLEDCFGSIEHSAWPLRQVNSESPG